MRFCLSFAALLSFSISSVSADIVVGTGAGGGPHVKAFSGSTGQEQSSFLAYGPSFTGGVRVAAGDVNGDGVVDIVTGTGPGAGPHVKVFDGATGGELRSFFAYDSLFSGGVFVASGDLDGDSYADIITGAGAGGAPHVKVFDGRTGSEVSSFNAYDALFSGGVHVASGDVNNDGFADIITGAGAGGAPHVKVFDGVSGAELSSFHAHSRGGGVFVAAGDLDGDNFAEIVTGDAGGSAPVVRIFNGLTGQPLDSFVAYNFSVDAGVRVAVGDLNGDGNAEIVTGAGTGSHVKVFNGQTGAELQSFLAFNPAFTGGVFVAAYTTVPEPTSIALLGFAIGGTAFCRRR